MGKVAPLRKRKTLKKGEGIINTLIDKLPFEAHLPSYQYCGPGTNLKKRLRRNDPGINELDRACKQHDIAYAKTEDVAERNRADNILASKAWQRFKSADASLGERAAALGVSGIMKAKSAMGAGIKIKTKKTQRTGSGIRYQAKKTTNSTSLAKSIPKAFRTAVKEARTTIRTYKPKSLEGAAMLALHAAKAAIKKNKIPKRDAVNALPRIIPVPKIGGVLPLVPIFAGLSALGALMGGSAGIANAVTSANKAKEDYNELKRHNETMEAIALGGKRNGNVKAGAGLYLKPYQNGLGLYLTPYQYSKNVF